MPSTWHLVPLVLWERNESCWGEGSISTSPGPRPWFYPFVNRICVAFTHVPGNLKRKIQYLFFFFFRSPVLPAPAPAGPSSLPPAPKMGKPSRGLSAPPGAGMAAGRFLAPASSRRQHPGLRLSSPALHRRDAAFAGHSGGPRGKLAPRSHRTPPGFRDSPSTHPARE